MTCKPSPPYTGGIESTPSPEARPASPERAEAQPSESAPAESVPSPAEPRRGSDAVGTSDPNVFWCHNCRKPTLHRRNELGAFVRLDCETCAVPPTPDAETTQSRCPRAGCPHALGHPGQCPDAAEQHCTHSRGYRERGEAGSGCGDSPPVPRSPSKPTPDAAKEPCPVDWCGKGFRHEGAHDEPAAKEPCPTCTDALEAHLKAKGSVTFWHAARNALSFLGRCQCEVPTVEQLQSQLRVMTEDRDEWVRKAHGADVLRSDLAACEALNAKQAEELAELREEVESKAEPTRLRGTPPEDHEAQDRNVETEQQLAESRAAHAATLRELSEVKAALLNVTRLYVGEG